MGRRNSELGEPVMFRSRAWWILVVRDIPSVGLPALLCMSAAALGAWPSVICGAFVFGCALVAAVTHRTWVKVGPREVVICNGLRQRTISRPVQLKMRTYRWNSRGTDVLYVRDGAKWIPMIASFGLAEERFIELQKLVTRR
jgi:hypothetical protein